MTTAVSCAPFLHCSTACLLLAQVPLGLRLVTFTIELISHFKHWSLQLLGGIIFLVSETMVLLWHTLCSVAWEENTSPTKLCYGLHYRGQLPVEERWLWHSPVAVVGIQVGANKDKHNFKSVTSKLPTCINWNAGQYELDDCLSKLIRAKTQGTNS